MEYRLPMFVTAPVKPGAIEKNRARQWAKA
jgi:hypothetical protein